MANMSNYLESKLIDHVLRNTAYTPPTTVYVALYTTDPTDADTGTEVSGGGYARQAATFGADTDGVSATTANIYFPTATASWGTITHIGIRDASTGGNLLLHDSLENSKSIDTDDIFTILTGNLTVTFA